MYLAIQTGATQCYQAFYLFWFVLGFGVGEMMIRLGLHMEVFVLWLYGGVSKGV